MDHTALMGIIAICGLILLACICIAIANKLEKKNVKSRSKDKVETKSNRDIKTYSTAFELLKKTDEESQLAGREMIVDLYEKDKYWGRNKNSYESYEAAMWIAQDYEKHDCFSLAAECYKEAYLAEKSLYSFLCRQMGTQRLLNNCEKNMKAAEEGYKRCYNPYHEYPAPYDIRKGKNIRLNDDYGPSAIKKKQEDDFKNAIDILNGNPSEEEVKKCFTTIYLIASAYGCHVVDAMVWMGEFSESVLKDDAEAVKWFKKAAERGNVTGARNYADMVMIGKGMEQNEEEAIKYYHVAAEAGQVESMFVLGQYYLKQGDTEKSYNFFKMAADNGFENAKEIVNEMEKVRMDENHSAEINTEGTHVRKNRSNDTIIRHSSRKYGPNRRISKDGQISMYSKSVQRNEAIKQKNSEIESKLAEETKKHVEIIFHKHYSSMFETTKSIEWITNADFEILPAMYVICDYSASSAGKERQLIADEVLSEIRSIYPKFDSTEFDNRVDLYGQIIRGKELRFDFAFGSSIDTWNNAVMKIIALLCDILYNPDCADDYDSAAVLMREVDETINFHNKIVKPLAMEMTDLFKEIYDL